MHLSLIIPAYNEAERIGGTLEKASAYFAMQPYEAEIIVVDDGSSDGTSQVVKEYAAKSPVALLLETLPENRGKGYAVRAGMLQGRLATIGSFMMQMLPRLLKNWTTVGLYLMQAPTLLSAPALCLTL